MSEGHSQCVHMVRFSEPTKIGSSKTDHVKGPSEVPEFKENVEYSPG